MSSIVASVTGQRGGNSGGAGLNYNAAGANILAPATVDQANVQYTNAQDALKRQQDFVTAMQAQNGLGNQSAVFNQMQGVADGTGPNPAQAMLNKATGANVANTAAVIAGARGVSSNPGMAARTAALAGSQAGQAQASDAASLQANQSLNALNNMGNIAGQQVANTAAGINSANANAQGEQGQVLGAIQGQNNANVGMVSNQNSANAGISAIAAKQQGDLIGNLTSGAGAAMMAMAKGGQVPSLGANANFDFNMAPMAPMPMTTDLGLQPAANQPPVSAGPRSSFGKMQSDPNKSAMANAGQTLGKGAAAGISSIGKSVGDFFKPVSTNEMIMNTGGKFGNGQSGPMNGDAPAYRDPNANGYDEMTRQNVAGGPDDVMANSPVEDPSMIGSLPSNLEIGADGGIAGTIQKLAPLAMLAANGGQVPALLSPGERYLPPQEAQAVKAGQKDPLKAGIKIPGKPKHPGNDLRNDVVPAKLEKGGLVIPNSILQSKSPHFAAMRFVHAHMMAHGGKVGSSKKSKK